MNDAKANTKAHGVYQTRDGDHNIHEMSVDFVVIARRQIGRPTSLSA